MKFNSYARMIHILIQDKISRWGIGNMKDATLVKTLAIFKRKSSVLASSVQYTYLGIREELIGNEIGRQVKLLNSHHYLIMELLKVSPKNILLVGGRWEKAPSCWNHRDKECNNGKPYTKSDNILHSNFKSTFPFKALLRTHIFLTSDSIFHTRHLDTPVHGNPCWKKWVLKVE